MKIAHANLALAVAATLATLAGCGAGRLIGFGADEYRVRVELAPQFTQPVYVAVYYLKQADAVNGIRNTDLVDKLQENLKLTGVVDAKAVPAYPGAPAEVVRPQDDAVETIVVAVHLAQDCARTKIPASKAKKVHLRLDEKNCLVPGSD